MNIRYIISRVFIGIMLGLLFIVIMRNIPDMQDFQKLFYGKVIRTAQAEPITTVSAEEKVIAEYIKLIRPTYPSKDVANLTKMAISYSKQHGVCPLLTVSIMRRESSFNPKAVSGVGATGLMQVYPKWHEKRIAKFKRKRESLFTPRLNIQVGTHILGEYTKRYGLRRGLIKYSGNAKDYPEKVLRTRSMLKRKVDKLNRQYVSLRAVNYS